IEAVDQGVGRRHRRAAVRNFVQHSLLGVAQSDQFGRLGGLRLGQFHLPEQCAGDQYRRHAADLLADVLPGPALLALDVEDFFGEVGTIQVGSPAERFRNSNHMLRHSGAPPHIGCCRCTHPTSYPGKPVTGCGEAATITSSRRGFWIPGSPSWIAPRNGQARAYEGFMEIAPPEPTQRSIWKTGPLP